MKPIKLLSIALILSSFACSSKSTKDTAVAAAVDQAKQVAAETPKAAEVKKVTEAQAPMDSKSLAAKATVTCKSGKDVRTLVINAGSDKAGKACELIYTKFGESKSLATANNDSAYCETVSKKVSEKLTAAGYTCE